MAKSWLPGAEPASSLCAPAAVLQLESGLPGRDLFLSSFPEKEKRECQAVVDGLRETLDVRNATIESLQKMLGDTEMLCSSLKVLFLSPAGLTFMQSVLVLLKISADPANKEIVLLGFWVWCRGFHFGLIN